MDNTSFSKYRVYLDIQNQFVNSVDATMKISNFHQRQSSLIIFSSKKLLRQIKNNVTLINNLKKKGAKGSTMRTQRDRTRLLLLDLTEKEKNMFTQHAKEVFDLLEFRRSSRGTIVRSTIPKNDKRWMYPTWEKPQWYGDNWIMSSAAVIYSKPTKGRAGSDQDYHLDAPPITDSKKTRNISCILYTAESHMCVVIDGEEVTITMYAGDVLFFWGNTLVHHGIGYKTENIRIFWYIDYTMTSFKYPVNSNRVPGKVYHNEVSDQLNASKREAEDLYSNVLKARSKIGCLLGRPRKNSPVMPVLPPTKRVNASILKSQRIKHFLVSHENPKVISCRRKADKQAATIAKFRSRKYT